MTRTPCCCTDTSDGHRCPLAWQLITEAQRASKQGPYGRLKAARMAYTRHVEDAGLLPRTVLMPLYPDVCAITINDDPRCARCAPQEEPA